MGNVMDGSFNRQMKNSFACANIYTKEDCKDCWASSIAAAAAAPTASTLPATFANLTG